MTQHNQPVGGKHAQQHVGWSKWMYQDYAFSSASMRGDQPPLIPANGASARPRDEEIDRERQTNWGER